MKNPKLNMVFVMFIFGSIGLFVRNIDLSSSQVALVRGIIGSLFLIAASIIMRQKITWKAIKQNLLLLILSGGAIGFNWIFLFQAYKFTTISNATLSYYFAPVFVMLLSPFLLKERLTPVKAICIAGAVSGMFLLIGIGEGDGKNHLAGIGYGLSAAVLYASVIILNRFMKGLRGLETTIIQLSTASVVLLPYVLITEKITFHEWTGKTVLFLITVGIIHTGLGYLIYFTSLNKLNGQTTAVLSYIDPISAIIMSSVFLGENMTLLQVIGGFLILGAALLNESYDKMEERKKVFHPYSKS